MKYYIIKQHLKESAITDKIDQLKNDNSLDGILTKYSLDSSYKHQLIDVFDQGIQQYGNDKSVTLYRGLNFLSKQSYDKFISSIRSNKITLKDVSSWSKNLKTAESFAYTRPMHSEFRDQLSVSAIQQAEDKGECVVGYRGVILKTTISKNQGIDFDKTDLTGESEVLLGPGTYRVSCKILKTFHELLLDQTIEQLIDAVKDHDQQEIQQLQKYIVCNYQPDQLTDEYKEKIFKVIFHKPEYEINVRKYGKYHKNYGKDTENNLGVIEVDCILPETYMIKWLTKSQLQKIKTVYTPTIKNMIKQVYTKYWNPGYKIQWNFLINNVVKLFDLQDYFSKYSTSTIGNQYKKLTSIETNKKINSLSGEDKQRALNQYKRDLKKLFSNITI